MVRSALTITVSPGYTESLLQPLLIKLLAAASSKFQFIVSPSRLSLLHKVAHVGLSLRSEPLSQRPQLVDYYQIMLESYDEQREALKTELGSEPHLNKIF